MRRHYFILGPSGVGKTTFGDFVAQRGKYLHLKIDTGIEGENGIDVEGIRDQWDILASEHDFVPLALKLNRRAADAAVQGCILTFPSGIVFDQNEIRTADKYHIAIRYLFASKERCISAFIKRESKDGFPEHDRQYWAANNKTYETIGGLPLAPYRVQVYDWFDNHLSCKEIAERLNINL